MPFFVSRKFMGNTHHQIVMGEIPATIRREKARGDATVVSITEAQADCGIEVLRSLLRLRGALS